MAIEYFDCKGVVEMIRPLHRKLNNIQENFGLFRIPPISNPRFQTFLKCKRDAPGQKDYRCKT